MPHTLAPLQRITLDVNVSPQEELAVHLLLLESWQLRRWSFHAGLLLLQDIFKTFNQAANDWRQKDQLTVREQKWIIEQKSEAGGS